MPLKSSGKTMSWPVLRFGKYWDWVEKREKRPVGLKGKWVEVLQLQQDSFKRRRQLGDTTPGWMLEMKDGSYAFFKPRTRQRLIRNTLDTVGSREVEVDFTHSHLREQGAYVLSQMIGAKKQKPAKWNPEGASVEKNPFSEENQSLDIIPRTELVDIPQLGGLGSIQDWVKGEHPGWNEIIEDKAGLYKLFIYLCIAYDSDKYRKNLVIDESKHLWSIDNDCSGSDPTIFRLKLPQHIMASMVGNKIPTDYQAYIKRFIANKKTFLPILLAYYPKERVEEFFERAQFLASDPIVYGASSFDHHLDDWRKRFFRWRRRPFSQLVSETLQKMFPRKRTLNSRQEK